LVKGWSWRFNKVYSTRVNATLYRARIILNRCGIRIRGGALYNDYAGRYRGCKETSFQNEE